MKNKRINGLIGVLVSVVVAAAVVVGVVLRNRSQPLSSGEIDALRTKYPQYSTTIIDTTGDCDRLAKETNTGLSQAVLETLAPEVHFEKAASGCVKSIRLLLPKAAV